MERRYERSAALASLRAIHALPKTHGSG